MGGLVVGVIGGLTATGRGASLPASAIGSRKARTLLAVLAVHRGTVPTERIVEALWPTRPPRDPTANVATLVSRLRATLGPGTITGSPAGRRLGPMVRVDLFDLADVVADVEAALTRGEHRAVLGEVLRATAALGEGEVLACEPGAVWADSARRLHGDLLRRARHACASAALVVGEVEAARASAGAAVTADWLDEAACRLLMRAHWAAGESARALLVYEGLRGRLARDLGVDPAQATRDLHVRILREGALSVSRSTERSAVAGGESGCGQKTAARRGVDRAAVGL